MGCVRTPRRRGPAHDGPALRALREKICSGASPSMREASNVGRNTPISSSRCGRTRSADQANDQRLGVKTAFEGRFRRREAARVFAAAIEQTRWRKAFLRAAWGRHRLPTGRTTQERIVRRAACCSTSRSRQYNNAARRRCAAGCLAPALRHQLSPPEDRLPCR